MARSGTYVWPIETCDCVGKKRGQSRDKARERTLVSYLIQQKTTAFWRAASTCDCLMASDLHYFLFHFYVTGADRKGTSWQLMITVIDPANPSVTGNI